MGAIFILVRAPSKLASESIARFVKGAPEPERLHETFCCRGDVAGGCTADATGILRQPGSRVYRQSSSFRRTAVCAVWPLACEGNPGGNAAKRRSLCNKIARYRALAGAA